MRRPKSSARTALLLVGGLVASTVPATAQEKDHASWWITNYGLVDASREPLAARAETIFERLAAVADKRANRFPRLAVLDAEGQPFAMALPDGTILLTRGALRICYRKVRDEIGDARLAFVIGHELSHLGNDDFWHAAAFDSLQRHRGDEALRSALELLEDSPDDAAKRELQADGYGMLYMTTAGFDPRTLLGEKSFFEEWADELDGLGIRAAAGHPRPEERGAFLRTQLAAISDEMDFFHFGARLVQLGRFQDGLLLLERFRDRFASREVLNDIGVAHYQLAARYLGNCDGRLVVRFMLPTVIDPTTRAVRLRSAGGSSPCFQAERFRLHFREAERNLQEASEMDPSYAPAKLNLLSLYALAEQGPQAILAADEASKLAPDDARVASGAAVALYLYGEQSGVEMADTAIGQLQTLHRLHADSKEAAYNLASMLAERRRVQAAEETYRAYLALQPTGIHAQAARDYLGEPVRNSPTASADGQSAVDGAIGGPPVPLGSTNTEKLAARMPGLEVEPFVIGDFTGSFIRFDGGEALAINDTVELIEQELNDPDAARQLRERLGKPRRTISTPTETLEIHRGIALIARDGQAVTLLRFSDRTPTP